MERKQALQRFGGRVGYSPEQVASISLDDPRARLIGRIVEVAPKYSIMARVESAQNCNSGYQPGDEFVLDVDGNFIAKRCPGRICVYLAAQMQVPVVLINERISEGLEPGRFHFMRTLRCADCGVEQGGYGQVTLRVTVEPRD